MLACMLGLTACSEEKASLKYDESVIESQCHALFGQCTYDFTDEEYATITSFNDYELENVAEACYKSYGIHIDGKTLLNAIDSYRSSADELGEITEAGKLDFDASEDELIVTLYVNGSVHNGSIEIIYDDNLTVTSVTTNVEYSFDELMVKAGTNTLIGMGTVFVMLIIIMIIIVLLGFVPKIFAPKKKEEPKKDGVDKAIEGIVAREEAEADMSSDDDLELVAVIAAAIASYEGTSTDDFVVRSIKRIK